MATDKIQNFFDNARWAETMMNEEKEACNKLKGFARQQAVKNYYYLSEWLDKFNRLSQGLNWSEHHNEYKTACKELSIHCNSL